MTQETITIERIIETTEAVEVQTQFPAYFEWKGGYYRFTDTLHYIHLHIFSDKHCWINPTYSTKPNEFGGCAFDGQIITAEEFNEQLNKAIAIVNGVNEGV